MTDLGKDAADSCFLVKPLRSDLIPRAAEAAHHAPRNRGEDDAEQGGIRIAAERYADQRKDHQRQRFGEAVVRDGFCRSIDRLRRLSFDRRIGFCDRFGTFDGRKDHGRRTAVRTELVAVIQFGSAFQTIHIKTSLWLTLRKVTGRRSSCHILTHSQIVVKRAVPLTLNEVCLTYLDNQPTNCFRSSQTVYYPIGSSPYQTHYLFDNSIVLLYGLLNSYIRI